MRKTICALLLMLFIATLIQAQVDYFTNGQLRASFGPGGATAPVGDTGAFLEIRNGDDWTSLVYDVGLLIGGFTPVGQLETYSSRGSENRAGFIGLDANIHTPWRVTAEEVEAHIADFEDNGVIDNPIASIFAWPGRGNPFSEEYNGFSLDELNVGTGANWWDVDQNSSYNPEAGDYPVLFLRGCDINIVPTEMWLYPQVLTNAEGDENIQLAFVAFRFACEEAGHAINNTLFLNYKMSHEVIERRDSSYVGFWIDGDIGCFNDDYIGTFPDRNSVYFYNAQATDDDCNPEEQFMTNPPVVGVDLLRSPLSWTPEQEVETGLTSAMPLFRTGFPGTFPAAVGNYTAEAELYNYLSGRWRDGSSLVDQGFGYGEGTPTDFAFTGDPLTETGWSEIEAVNPAADRTVILGSGPFVHFPWAVNDYLLSITYNFQPEAGHLEQIGQLRNRIDSIQSFYDNCFDLELGLGSSCTQVITSIETLETPTKNQLLLYPNPTHDQVNIILPANGTGTLSVLMPNGQMLLQKRTTSENLSLDLSAWPKGLYLLRWEGEQEVCVNKLLVD